MFQLESCMENAYDRKWAARLSDSLSWAVDGEDEEEYYSEELLRVRNSYPNIFRFLESFIGLCSYFYEYIYLNSFKLFLLKLFPKLT